VRDDRGGGPRSTGLGRRGSGEGGTAGDEGEFSARIAAVLDSAGMRRLGGFGSGQAGLDLALAGPLAGRRDGGGAGLVGRRGGDD
jgi:hypothetical protein